MKYKQTRHSVHLNNVQIENTPGTRVGPGFHNRTLAVKSRESPENQILNISIVYLNLDKIYLLDNK